MMYPYMTLPDETEITHSHLMERCGQQTVEVHFERPREGGFDSARCVLPTYTWKFNEGYSPEEIAFFEEFLRYNAHLICRMRYRGLEHRHTVPSVP